MKKFSLSHPHSTSHIRATLDFPAPDPRPRVSRRFAASTVHPRLAAVAFAQVICVGVDHNRAAEDAGGTREFDESVSHGTEGTAVAVDLENGC